VAAVAGGALVTVGAIAERFTVFRAGARSAARPQDTVEPQRERLRRGARSQSAAPAHLKW
jgi:hypothetical protein